MIVLNQNKMTDQKVTSILKQILLSPNKSSYGKFKMAKDSLQEETDAIVKKVMNRSYLLDRTIDFEIGRCLLCHKVFKDKQLLQKHITSVHEKKTVKSDIGEADLKIINRENNPVKTVKCIICEATSSNCEQSPHLGVFTCTECESILGNHQKIIRHEKRVIRTKRNSSQAEDGLYHCQICDKAFKKAGWKIHMSRKHLPLVKCDFCNWRTNKMSKMLKHRSMFHEDPHIESVEELEEEDLFLHLTDSEAEEQNGSELVKFSPGPNMYEPDIPEEEIASLHIKIEIDD